MNWINKEINSLKKKKNNRNQASGRQHRRGGRTSASEGRDSCDFHQCTAFHKCPSVTAWVFYARTPPSSPVFELVSPVHEATGVNQLACETSKSLRASEESFLPGDGVSCKSWQLPSQLFLLVPIISRRICGTANVLTCLWRETSESICSITFLKLMY